MAATTNNPPLTRATLAAATERVLRHASGAKPAILLVRSGGRHVIVKDFSQSPWLTRHVYARWLVGRETRAYARLAGLPGVPAFRGRLDDFAFAVDYVEGATLNDLPHRDIPAKAFDELATLIGCLHARGIIHFDCRQKTNVVLAPDGRPHLVDFASAVYVGTGWLGQRLLVPLLGWADWSGLRKLRARYRPETVTPEDAQTLRRASWLGWLWPPTVLRRLARRLRVRRRAQKKP